MMTAALIKALIFYIISSAHVVQPQLTQAQPCLICGDAVLRIWSLMSRQGDRYLRITSGQDAGNNNHKIVDCGGGLQHDNFTSLLKIRERSTFSETRLQFVLARDNKQYHLYAPSAGGQLLAMPASEGEQQTDNRNTWAPERLLYEHRLFTVFQSVKYRGYYLSCDGSGKAVMQQIINKAYREPNQLFLTIDPGNAIRGVTFGASNTVGRKKREMPTQKRGYTARRLRKAKLRWNRFKLRKSYKKRPYNIRRPKPYYTITKKPPTTPPPKYSSVVTNFNLPQNITFVLCFWIKTMTKFAQLISVTESKPQEEAKETAETYWRRWYTYGKKKEKKKNNKRNNIINVSIFQGKLRLEVGYRRTTRTLSNCDITDGKFHQICISLNQDYLLEVYRDSVVIQRDSLPGLACDFRGCNGHQKTRRGALMLGRNSGMTGRFDGSLFQVNLWDQYPSFRIKRIATNCACGGGTLVSWSDLLNATMSNVDFDNNSECPKLEGYNYDEITQNRLI